MDNKKLMVILFLVFIGFATIGYFILKPKLSVFASLSEEKCENEGDDCWHSLAHQTFNKTYCLKIIDNKTQEHCLEHIPEVNKDNK